MGTDAVRYLAHYLKTCLVALLALRTARSVDIPLYPASGFKGTGDRIERQ